MPRNPSEMYREWEEERERIRVMFRDFPFDKSTKMKLLARLRTVEELLDVKALNYNSTEFANWVRRQ